MKTVEWTEQGINILDQSRLPGEVVYENLATVDAVACAIKSLKVRGAPLIGIVGAMGIALAAKLSAKDVPELDNDLYTAYDQLLKTRPTAVNLQWGLSRMMGRYLEDSRRTKAEVVALLEAEARAILAEDVETNRQIGQNGEILLHSNARIMTICNAGALATGGYGTALGVIRSAHASGKVERVWACETRPVLQGARLTVWELTQDQIPVTLITDNMAGYVMQRGEVDAIIVGADRVAANGDTANKIGTYSLAVLANYHHIPFYIAAPVSTIDTSIPTGAEIPIETRDADEVRRIQDRYTTVPDVDVYNPAFDVTPNALIHGIITERGVARAPYLQSIRQMAGGGHCGA
ncbi:MAG: S-methyl-5-thioribose-1-phosphate isomerase [Solirubrobacterales bacterium]